jgi:hypothetical protein
MIMRRLRLVVRWALKGLTAVSLLLLLGTAVLWARSPAHGFAFCAAPADGRYWSVWSGRRAGRAANLEITSVAKWTHPPFRFFTLDGYAMLALRPAPGRGGYAHDLGMGVTYEAGNGVPLYLALDPAPDQPVRWPPAAAPVAYWNLGVPFWIPAVVFALAPAVSFAAFVLRRRKALAAASRPPRDDTTTPTRPATST